VSTTPAEGYYAARRERMLRGFDRASPRFARSLERHHDAAFAEQVPREARVEFERLPEQTMRVAADVSDELFRSFPGLVLRLVGRLAFTPPVRHVLRKQAERSQERRFGADFVFQFREGDGDDWALVFDECAVNKFYEAQGTPELSPYCNFFDVTYSRLMGLGLDASETIGLGCPQCKLRFAHGRATPVPKTLAAVLPGAGS
jgi:hypothetical protein